AGSLIDAVIGVLGCWAASCAAVLLPGGSDAPAVSMTAATEPAGPGDIPIRRVTGSGCAAYLPAREDAALILAYGGTSVVLSHDALAEAAAALAAELPLDSSDLVAVGPSARSGPELLEVLLALASGARVLPLSAADEAAAR